MTVAEKVSVLPFGIEIDTPHNGDMLIQSIPGCRLRGAISPSKPTKNVKTGDLRIPQDASRHLGLLPPIPGMELHVNPDKCTYQVVDPLYEDDDLCERIRRSLERNSPYRLGDKLRGAAPIRGTLDAHRMKTLCREMVRIIAASQAKVIKGVKPEMVDIDRLPGNYLLNPGSVVTNMQPMYEQDWEKWVAQLTRSGG